MARICWLFLILINFDLLLLSQLFKSFVCLLKLLNLFKPRIMLLLFSLIHFLNLCFLLFLPQICLLFSQLFLPLLLFPFLFPSISFRLKSLLFLLLSQYLFSLFFSQFWFLRRFLNDRLFLHGLLRLLGHQLLFSLQRQSHNLLLLLS